MQVEKGRERERNINSSSVKDHHTCMRVRNIGRFQFGGHKETVLLDNLAYVVFGILFQASFPFRERSGDD